MQKLLIIGALSGLLVACGGDDVSWETQETSRKIAIENSEFNARNFRQKNEHYSNYKIFGRGDSTIGPNCASGDGWASVDLVDSNGTVKEKLKCSTASATIGCLVDKDFNKKPYAKEEGRCNTNLPKPLKTFVQ
jgi:hypothetical protein